MWTSFGASAAGIGAGLTSLAFLVVAFRFDPIATSDEYRNRAAQVLTMFVAITIAAIATLVPQSPRALGIEFAVVAAASGVMLAVLDAAVRRAQTQRSALLPLAGLMLFVIALAAAGVPLILGDRNGLYAFAAAVALALVNGVTGAWNFLTGAGRSPSSQTT